MRPTRLVAGLAAAALLLAAAGASHSRAAEPPLARAVSLGDSFSSGEGNPPFDPGTDAGSIVPLRRLNRCHRSPLAWPRLLGAPVALHLACSGAVIGNLHAGQERRPPDDVGQLDRLRALVAHAPVPLVTITIGGNDLGFARILRSCLNVFRDCLRDLGGTEFPRLRRIGNRLVGTYQEVRGAARGARVLVVGYPNIFPGPSAPWTCPWASHADRRRLAVLSDRLEATLADAARRAGVEFVSVRSSLSGHELCTPDRWVKPLLTEGLNQQQAHPTEQGQRAIAAAVRRYLARRPA